MRSHKVARFVAALGFVVCGTLIAVAARSGKDSRLSADGVYALLDAMDTIASRHSGFEEKTQAYAAMADPERVVVFELARQRNEADKGVLQAIDNLLATPTYQIYFRRFTNVTPEMVRDILLDLPYKRRSAPGGIGGMFYALIREREDVRTLLATFMAGVDMERVHETALRWVPAGDYDMPTVRLIYDSNAGSFTAEDQPFFNLHSETLFSEMDGDAGTLAIEKAEGIMAHELQHVLAQRYLYPWNRPRTPWERKWADKITRGLVSEGAAKHCNPPEGFNKELWEDEEVVSALVKRLNECLLAIRDKAITEDEVKQWHKDNFHNYAFKLLRRHLLKQAQGPELKERMDTYASMRPDMEHALGWWMVSRISEAGAHREAVFRLLRDPYALYSLYNESIPKDHADLRIDAQVVAYIATLPAN